MDWKCSMISRQTSAMILLPLAAVACSPHRPEVAAQAAKESSAAPTVRRRDTTLDADAHAFLVAWNEKREIIKGLFESWRLGAGRRFDTHPVPYDPPRKELDQCAPVLVALHRLAGRRDYDLNIFGPLSGAAAEGEAAPTGFEIVAQAARLVRIGRAAAANRGARQQVGALMALAERLAYTTHIGDPRCRAAFNIIAADAAAEGNSPFMPVLAPIAPNVKPSTEASDEAESMLREIEAGFGEPLPGAAEVLANLPPTMTAGADESINTLLVIRIKYNQTGGSARNRSDAVRAGIEQSRRDVENYRPAMDE